MGNYSKMQAPPFWMWMFRIVGVACLVTLITPAAYLIKYTLHDHPHEVKIAASSHATALGLSSPAKASGVDWYIASAESNDTVLLRTLAIERLGDLAKSTFTEITYPVECFHAKLALEQIADSDPNPSLRAYAQTTLMSVAEHGAVIDR